MVVSRSCGGGRAFRGCGGRPGAAGRRGPECAARASVLAVHLAAQHLDDEGVVDGFVSDGRFGSVTGVDAHLVAQGQDLFEDRAHDPRVVAARQVGAADALAEERVAREERLRLRLVERHVSGRVSGRGDDLQRGVAEADFGHGVQVDVGRRGHGADLHAEDLTADRGVLQQETVLAREGEGDAVGRAQPLHAERVVEVAVRIDRHRGPQSVLLEEVAEGGVLAFVGVARVDYGALGRVVPHDVGVFLYRIELETSDFHDFSLFVNTEFLRAKIVFFARISPIPGRDPQRVLRRRPEELRGPHPRDCGPMRRGGAPCGQNSRFGVRRIPGMRYLCPQQTAARTAAYREVPRAARSLRKKEIVWTDTGLRFRVPSRNSGGTMWH